MDLIPITHDRTRASSSSFASMYVTSKTEQASTYQYYYPPPPIPTPSPSFPIAAVTILSIISIAFLLLSYYIFVIKCCLNWQQLSPLLSRLSTSASPSGHNEDSLIFYSPSMEINRGLDQSAIRNLPTLQYNKVGNSGGIGRVGDRSLRCCSVCLSGFKDREMLRVLPRCNHVFHLDCIDVWLLKNANCPLCRSSISGRNRYPTDRIVAPSTSPEEMVSCDGIVLGDGTEEEDYVVVELSGISGGRGEQERQYDRGTISVDEARLGHSKRNMVPRKGRTLHHHGPSIMGDECIDGRGKDEQFSSIQPIKRSFSMDSAGDRGLYLQVHEIVRRQSSLIDVNESTGESNSGTSSSSRVSRSRSFFTIGSGRRSSSVLPVESNI